ncbi:MAG: hypothetical protein IJ086_00575 [Clostridium sp.]|nr:hypothetical protein [Clostridium sp.]
MTKPNETIKSYYSANICAKCDSYNNGMCLKHNSKPYIARYECEKLNKILEENKRVRLEERELEKQQAFESKYPRICKIKELLDDGASTEFILNELNIGKNRFKNDKKVIKEILNIRNYMDKGLSDCKISQATGYTLEKISTCKIYINRNPDLFK